MPTFSFVGDEPLPTPCSVVMSNKMKQTYVNTGGLKDSSHTTSDANPPERSSSSTSEYEYSRVRISHPKPGPLGVKVKLGIGECSSCFVAEKLNDNSQLNVDDIIISVNGRRYDDMIKLEGGVAAWLDLLKGPGEREFDVLRRQESNAVGAKSRSASAPISFVPGKNVKAMEVVPMPVSSAARDYTSLRNARFAEDPQIWNAAREVGNRPLIAGEPNAGYQEEMTTVLGLRQEERYALLQEVSRNWISGKSCVQTPQCMSAIRNCLLNDISHIDIARHVSDASRHLGSECQRIERERARACAYRENKTLRREKAQDAVQNVDKVAKKVDSLPPIDLKDTLGISNGVDNNNVDILHQKASIEDLEEGLAALKISSSSEEEMDDNDTTTQSHGSYHQASHWFDMWKDAKAELKKLREELKDETDEEVKAELKSDIDGLKRKKDEWAELLGMKE